MRTKNYYKESGVFMEFEKIKAILVEQLGIDEDEITLESNLLEDLSADSLDLAEMMMALEEEFDIEIPDDEAEKIKTVSDVVKFIKEKTN